MLRERAIAMLLVVASGVACGVADLEMSGRRHQVNQAIWAAEQAGARDDARSARLVERARGELMDAQATADAGDERNAALLFDRAEVDARLARQIARTGAERDRARRAWHELGAARSGF